MSHTKAAFASAMDAKVAFMNRMRTHLAQGDRFGCIAIPTEAAGDGSTVQVVAVNASRFQIRAAAEELCKAAMDLLDRCTCGRDHSLERAQIDGARALLVDACAHGQVRQ